MFDDHRRETSSFDDKALCKTNYLLATRGYAVIEGFLDQDTVIRLRELMVDAIAKYKPRDGIPQSINDVYQIHDLMVKHRDFCDLLEDVRLDRLLASHLGAHWIMYAATSSSIPPMGANYSSRIHVDSPRFHLGYIFNMGVIWTLNEYAADNGALEVLPGSQHFGQSPTDELFNSSSVKVLCPAGSLIVFNARLFHRTSTNNTAGWRHAMTMNACRSFMKPRMDWVRMIPAPFASTLGPQARRILGFDTRIPVSLDEFFMPEADRLYKPGQG
jgi:hypothetical protein